MSAPSVGTNAFLLCDYFNEQGKRVDRIYIVNESGDEAADKVRELVRSANLEKSLDAMFAEANASGELTDPDDAALALNVLLNEVAEDRMPLGKAREIASIGVNFRMPLPIADIVPALETNFGGYAVSWVRGIFRRLNLGTPHLQ